LGAGTVMIAEGQAAGAAAITMEALRRVTGFPLPSASITPKTDCILWVLDASLGQRMGEEGYRLVVTPERMVLSAPSEAGLFYAGMTLRQLLPAEVFGCEVADRRSGSWGVPCLEIEDTPRFKWRGLLLDPARHFFPPEFVRKLLDGMALNKLNVLQLHLTAALGRR